MKDQKNIIDERFAACTAQARLLIFFMAAARRAANDGWFGSFNFSAGGHFRDSFTPLPGKNILTRHGIFRGKISRRNNQKPKTNLDERTHLRQNP